jgi:predicted ATPase
MFLNELSELQFDAAVSSAASTASNSTTFNVLYPSKRDLGGEGGLRMLVVKGAAGSGKSSVLLRECHREIPATALVGQAKFDPGLHTPYSAILQCLASVFRQLLTFTNAEIFAFGNALHERLGPQISVSGQNDVQTCTANVPQSEYLSAFRCSARVREAGQDSVD